LSQDGSVLYVVDRNNNRIRAVAIASRAVTTLAGNGSVGGSNGVGTAGVSLNGPMGLALSHGGAVLYVTEAGGNRVRSIRLDSGVVDTVIGSPWGTAGNALGIGISALVSLPFGVVVE
jgi:sugar lactone lactonase YvrE